MDNDLLLALVLGGITLIIPIVFILTKHQQKMAEIVHKGQFNAVPNAELEMLRREVSELKQIIHQQTIDSDSMKGRPTWSVSQNPAEVQFSGS